MATIDERIKALDPQTLDAVNKYVDDLKNEAQGDYDFVVKYLKQQFNQALGTDDTARAAFLSNVADSLEARIGRIPYDYEQKTAREKEDLANYFRARDIEDRDQRARELEFKAQQEFEIGNEQEAIRLANNAKGMLDSGIQLKQQEKKARERELFTTQPQQRQFQLEQTRRDEQRRIAELESQRGLQDIKTQARRGAADEQMTFARGTEGAQRSLSQRLAEITRLGESEKLSALQGLQAEELLARQTQAMNQPTTMNQQGRTIRVTVGR